MQTGHVYTASVPLGHGTPEPDASEEKLFGLKPLAVLRILGAIGVLLGGLTVLTGFFVGLFTGIFMDGVVTIIVYATLLCVCEPIKTGLCAAFVATNAVLLLGKTIYWLMLLVDTYRIRYGYGYALPGTYRTASDVIARDGFSWPFGLFGNHDRDHYKGTYGAYAYEHYDTMMVLTLVGLGMVFFFCAFAEFIAAHVLQTSRRSAIARRQFRIAVARRDY
ncbi:hypothetical protein AAVH_16753 [Aphelenchoides avenae]|nr:hypothetical protein AAVH_16753 [Aphelenchus avenae]